MQVLEDEALTMIRIDVFIICFLCGAVNLVAGSLIIPDFDAIRAMHLPPPHSEYFNPWSPDGDPRSLPYRSKIPIQYFKFENRNNVST
jgi:hypothetical protein